MKLVLDVENTVSKRDGVMYLDPFEKDNSLVMVGVLPDAMYKHDEGPLPDTKCHPVPGTIRRLRIPLNEFQERRRGSIMK